MTPEDTPRMAERTDRQAQIDPWKDIDDREEYIGGTWYLTRDYVDAARSADAALLRERDAQIAKLQEWNDAQRVQLEAAEAQIASLTKEIADTSAAMQEFMQSGADYARRIEAERDAAQQENQTLREALKAAWCELIQHDDQPWVKTLAGQVRVVGLFASPRPQEPQP